MDETPTPEQIAGIRYAIEQLKTYYQLEGRRAFLSAVRVSDPAAAYWIKGFAELVDMQLQNIEETYGVPKEAVFRTIEELLCRGEK